MSLHQCMQECGLSKEVLFHWYLLNEVVLLLRDRPPYNPRVGGGGVDFQKEVVFHWEGQFTSDNDWNLPVYMYFTK